MKLLTSILLIVASLAPTWANAYELAMEEDHSLPLSYINVAFKPGAITDPDDTSGLTQFLGEILLRGTRLRTKDQIDSEIDRMGAQLGVEVRAESTIIRGAVLRSQLKGFLVLVGEILSQPSFNEREIERLKSEATSHLLEEMSNDSSLGSRWFARHLFDGHPYGKPVNGTPKGVAKITAAALKAHYEKYFRASNLILIGAGDVTEKELRAWGDELEKQMPGGVPVTPPAAPTQKSGRRLLVVDKPDRTQTQVFVGQIGVKMSEPRFFALQLGNSVFGGGTFTSRLMQEIRVKRGWSYGANSHFRFGTQPRYWQAHLFPAAKDTAAALAHSLAMIKELRENGVTQDEFAHAQTMLVNSSAFMFNTPKKRVENILLERTLGLPTGFMRTHAKELGRLRLSDVNSALRDYLRPEDLSITVVGTAKDLKAKLAEAAGVPVDRVEVVPYTQD